MWDIVKRAALERFTTGQEGARHVGAQLTGFADKNVQLLLEALLARTFPAGGTTGQVPKKTSSADYAISWQNEAAGGSTQPFPDNTALVKNNTDATKLIRVDASGVATGTTRVLTMPNSNVTLANVPAIASQAQADAGTDDATFMSPLKVANRPQKNSVFETHMQGLQLTWNTPGNNGNLLTVSTGSAWIPSLGRVYNVPSAITGPTQTLTASSWHYVYLYDNAGTPAIEISTTAPAAPYKGTARTKTADTSRRFIGTILTDATATPIMRQFLHNPDNSIIYLADTTASPYRVLNGVGPGVSNTTQSLVAVCPPGITTDVLVMLTAATGASVVGNCFLEWKLVTAGRAGILGGYIGAVSSFAFTTAWLPVNAATPSFIYSTTGPTASVFFVDVSGYRIAR